METASQRLKRAWITRRKNGNDVPWNKKPCPDINKIRFLYIDQKKSLKKISKEFKVSEGLVIAWLHNARIKTRPRGIRVLPHPMKGKKYPESTVKKRAGKNHYNWQGGITPLNKQIRNSREYNEWREAVFKRDNYTCQICGKKGGDLHADHIKPFALYPKLRLVKENGRTLCIPCHRKTPTYGGNVKPTKLTHS